MTVQFYELPAGQASPTVVQTTSAVGYCTASDVASLNKARAIGVGDNPTLGDINGYILMTAGQIDAVLVNKGFSVPVNTASTPEVEGLLAYVNATGAWAMMEAASPNGPNVDRAKAAFDLAMQMLESAKFTLDAPMDQQRAEVRAPYLTWQPPCDVYDPALDQVGGFTGDGISGAGRNSRSLPMISRSLRF